MIYSHSNDSKRHVFGVLYDFYLLAKSGHGLRLGQPGDEPSGILSGRLHLHLPGPGAGLCRHGDLQKGLGKLEHLHPRVPLAIGESHGLLPLVED